MDALILSPILPFHKQALVFTCLQYKSFKNTVGKGEIAFYPFGELPYLSNFTLSPAHSFSLEETKICLFGKG